MKTIVLKPVLALLTACAVFSACSNDKQDVYNNADNGITYLPLPEEMHIHPLGDVINVSYTSDEDWKVRFSDSYQDWVSMTGSGRAGTSKLSISVSPNVQSDNDRDLTISFCSTDGKVVYDEFTIFQNVAILEVNQESFDLGWKKPEDNKVFTVTSNIQWRMTLDNASQFAEDTEKVGKICGTLDTEFELSDEDVKFTPVENNLDPEDRTAVFTIKPVKLDNDDNEVQLTDTDLEKLTKKVSVSQDYLLFLLNGGRYDITLSGFSELGKDYVETNLESINPEEHEYTKTFSITSEEEVTFDQAALAAIGGELVEGNHTEVELPDGRTAIKTDYTLYMTKPNPETKDFDYALKFWAVEDNTAFRTVNVKQKPYVFNLQTEDNLSTYINQGNEVKKLTVNTTGPWKLDTEKEQWEEWLSIEPTSGIGTTELTVTSNDRNLKFDDLEQELQFSSELHGGNTEFASIEKTVIARQARFQFDVTPDNKLNASLSRANEDTHSISVTSSGEWAYKLKYDDVDKDWLNTEISTQGDALCVTPSMNEEETQRTVEVEIWSVLHQDAVEKEGKQFKEDDWKKKCSIKQDALLFELKDLDDKKIFEPEIFAAYGSSPQGIFFKCSAKWKIIYEKEADKEWLKFLTTDNEDILEYDDYEYTTIQMKAETNTGDQIREAKVSVVADINEDGTYGDRQIPLTVTQDGFVFDVKVNNGDAVPSSVGVLNEWYNTVTIPVEITTTEGAGWEIVYEEEEDKWVGGPDETIFNGNQPISFTPKNNPTMNDRRATIKVKSTVTGNEKLLFSISQSEYSFNTTEHKSLAAFNEISSKNTDRKKVSLGCTTGARWYVESKPDWITITDENLNEVGGADNYATSKEVYINTNANNLDKEKDRPDAVIIKSVLGSYEKKINVKQKKYVWSVTPNIDNIEITDGEEHSQTFYVNCSADWDYKLLYPEGSESEFADFEKDGQSGKLTVPVNYTNNDRTATLIIKSEHYNDDDGKNLKCEVPITQKAFVYDVSVLDEYKDDNGAITILFKAGKDLTKTIRGLNCSGTWITPPSISPKESGWITASFDQKGVLTITVEENKETETREANITIRNKHYDEKDPIRKNFQTTFKVIQEAAEEEK